LQVSPESSLYVQHGISIADHNIDLGYNGYPSYLYFDGSSQSVNNLNITPAGIGYIFPGGPNTVGVATLTLGNNVTIHGGAQIENCNGGIAVINNGTINADSACPTLLGLYTFINNGTAEATNGGSLDIICTNVTNTGTIALHDGTVIDTAGLSVGQGTLCGSGTINGAVTLGSNPSTLAFQIRSASDYDSMAVYGYMAIAGNLQVTLANGFTPTSTQVFTLMAVQPPSTMGGAFANIADGASLETADGSGSFTVNYADATSGDEIVLSDFVATTPEPSSVAALGICAIAMLPRRRRRRMA
jgi:hypothetical protein